MAESQSERILIRVKPSEKLAFISRAHSLGLTLTAWMRAALRIEVGLDREQPVPDMSGQSLAPPESNSIPESPANPSTSVDLPIPEIE